MRSNGILTRACTAGLYALGFVRGYGAMLFAILILLSAHSAAADILPDEPAPTTTLHVALDKSEALNVTGDIERIVVAQPEIAKVSAAGAHSLYVQGREIGATNLLVYGKGGQLLQVVNVEVGYDGRQLQADLRAEMPTEPITVETLSSGLLLRGAPSTPLAAATAEALAEHAAPGAVISLLDTRPDQVMLEIQLVEVSEENLRDFGAEFNASGRRLDLHVGSGPVGVDPPHTIARLDSGIGGLDLDFALRALERRGAARILAKPRILALSGEKATFRAGGEFPFPVPQDGGKVTIEFRPYGTSMTVVPTVQANGFIRLELQSEVSQLDPRNSLRLAGVTVPSLSVRRAATSLDLRDGETFLFAGLYQDSQEQQGKQSPSALEAPGLGKLFHASRTRDQRLQLAIFVTAHLVRGPNVDTTKDLDDLDAMLPTMAEAKAPPPASSVAATPPKPKGLAKLVQKSPLATAVATRVTGLVHGALRAPGKAWTLVEGWTRRIAAAARARAPPAQAELKDAIPLDS